MFLRADNGHALKTVEGAFQPAWSPDGSRVTFFRTGTPDLLVWMDHNFGEPRRLNEVRRPGLLPAPTWSSDGHFVLSVQVWSRPAQPRFGPRSMFAIDLFRLRPEGQGPLPPPRPLSPEPLVSVDHFRGASLSYEADGEEFFFTTNIRDRKFQVVQAAANGSNHRLFNPFDEDVPVGALAFSRPARRLALRVGGADIAAGVALCDPETEPQVLKPLVTDDAARAAWLARTVTAARSILAEMPARGEPGGPEVERPTLLPSSVELAEDRAAAVRLKRLGGIAHAVCARSDAEGPPDAATARLLEDASVFANYLRGEYAEARNDLDRLEARDGGPDTSRRLLALRAQIDLGSGDKVLARAELDYLRTTSPGPAQRIEATAAGPVLSDVPGSLLPWLDLFSDQVEHGPRPNPDEPPPAPSGAHDPEPFELPNIQDLTPLPRPVEPPVPIEPRPGPRDRGNAAPRL
jgi:hypothetical protein